MVALGTASTGRVLTVVALGYLLASWAMNPVSAILPTITSDLGVDVTRAGWILNAYFVLLVSGALIAGRLGDAFGHGSLFRAGCLTFAAGSLLALVASIGVLVVLFPVLKNRVLPQPALGQRFHPTE